MLKFTRRSAIASIAALGLVATAIPAMADGHKMTFTLATSGSETDQRSVAMASVFAPMVAEFADYQPGTMALCLLRVLNLKRLQAAT